MDSGLATIVGAILGGLFTLLGIVIARFLTSRQERTSERDQWLRDRYQSIYENCIYTLQSVSTLTKRNRMKERGELITQLHEANKWLMVLMIYEQQDHNDANEQIQYEFDKEVENLFQLGGMLTIDENQGAVIEQIYRSSGDLITFVTYFARNNSLLWGTSRQWDFPKAVAEKRGMGL